MFIILATQRDMAIMVQRGNIDQHGLKKNIVKARVREYMFGEINRCVEKKTQQNIFYNIFRKYWPHFSRN